MFSTDTSSYEILRCAGAGCGGTPSVVAAYQASPTEIAMSTKYAVWLTDVSVVRIAR